MRKLKDLNPNVPAAIICAILAAIVLFIAPTSSRADEWDTTDKALMASYVALQAIDVAQTKKVLGSGGYEMNPVFGKHPSDGQLIAGKVFVTGMCYWILDNHPEYRTEGLIVINAIQLITVRHNYVGANVGFGF